jgi:hypothetical protein
MLYDHIATDLIRIENEEKDAHGHHLSHLTRAAQIATSKTNKRITPYDLAIILQSMVEADISINPQKQDLYVKSMYYAMLARALCTHTDADLPKTFLADIEAQLDDQISKNAA